MHSSRARGFEDSADPDVHLMLCVSGQMGREVAKQPQKQTRLSFGDRIWHSGTHIQGLAWPHEQCVPGPVDSPAGASVSLSVEWE